MKDTNKLVEEIEKKFNLYCMPPDTPFHEYLSKMYPSNIRRLFCEKFSRNSLGLMLDNCKSYNRVFLAVFLSREILTKLFCRDIRDAILIVHHPMEFQTSGVGFIPLSEYYFNELARRRISVISVHAPLDCHGEISTTLALLNRLKLRSISRHIHSEFGDLIWLAETESVVPFEEFCQFVREQVNVANLRYVKKQSYVHRLCVVAGGASCPVNLGIYQNIGCDTFLTGEYENRVKNEYGEDERRGFEAVLPNLKMNLIGASHYATEKIVFEDSFSIWMETLGNHAELIEQDDPWY